MLKRSLVPWKFLTKMKNVCSNCSNSLKNLVLNLISWVLYQVFSLLISLGVVKDKNLSSKFNEFILHRRLVRHSIKRRTHWEMRRTLVSAPEITLTYNCGALVLGAVIFLYLCRKRKIKFQEICNEKSVILASFKENITKNFLLLLAMSTEMHHMWHEASVVEMRENHNVVVFKELLMAGDVELNPGPYPPELLARLMNDFAELGPNYYSLGVQLKVPLYIIEEIKNDTGDRLARIFDHWLHNNQEDMWFEQLYTTLQQMKRSDLANIVQQKYMVKSSEETPLSIVEVLSTESDSHFKDVVTSPSVTVKPTSVDTQKDVKTPIDFMGLEINDERIMDLEVQTLEMHGKFRNVLDKLFDFVKANSFAKEKMQWVLHQECPIKGMIKSNYDHDPIDFSSESGIMSFLSQHSSFFNFELVETAINAIDFEEGKKMFALYKKNFEVYAQNRVIECPTCLDKTTEGDHCCCYVFLDENFRKYQQVYLKKLQRDIKNILGKNILLRVHGVFPGSVAVVFHISASLMVEIFPLSDEKIQFLKELIYGSSRIQKLICGFYSYTINSTTTVDSPSMASADLEKLEEEFLNYIDRFSSFEEEITAALTPPEVLYGVNMHWHASHGHLEQIQRMIRKGFYDPSIINEHGNTALHCAVQAGHLTLVKYCIETLKLDFIPKNRQNRSLLHLAAISCNVKLVQYLLALSCFDLYDKDIFNAVPLHYSCAFGSVEITQILIEKMTNNVTLNKMLVRTSIDHSFEAFNPFHIAIGRGQTKILYYFIKNLSHNCSEDVFSLVLSVKHCHILQFLLHTQNFSSEAKHLALFMSVNAVFVDSINFLSAVAHCKIPHYVCMKNLPLFLAVQQGDLKEVQFLAKKNTINWNEVSMGHRTLLHQACLEGYLHIAKYLIEEQSVQVQVPDKYKCSPLHLACINGNVQLIKYLVSLEAKIDPISENVLHNTPLHYASINGRFDAVKFLLDTIKLDPNLKGSGGSTPLHFACQYGHLNIVQYLIETWDCDPLCNNDFSFTPLDKAVLSGHLKIVKYLTKDWNSIPLPADSKKDNLLQIATWHDKIEVLRYFLEEKGCDMKYYEYKSSLLHVSCISGSLKVTKYLVEDFHMDPKSKTVYGSTPLHYASLRGNLETVKFLKDFFQPYEEIQDDQSGTPLSLATFKGHTEVVQFLIENDMYDSDTKILDDSYLHVIAFSGHLLALKLLLATGKFDVHCRNKCGQTPLMIACMHGHLQLAKYFIETHHCDPVAVDNSKNNCLHYSALSSLDLVKYLIEELNLDPNTKRLANNEPLHMASDKGKLDIVEYLVLKQKCDPNVKADFSVCPIHYAACGGHLPVLKFLISQGCNPFTRNDGNSTPFFLAALCGRLEIIKYYVEEYGSLRDFQQHFNSAISMARKKEQHEVVSYLESQLHIASAKHTNPVVCTTDEIKKMMPPIMDEGINKQKYEDWNRFYNIFQAEKATKLNYFSTLPGTSNAGLHFVHRFM